MSGAQAIRMPQPHSGLTFSGQTELGIRPQGAPGSPSRAVFPEEPRVMGLPGLATPLPPDGPESETRCPPPPALGSRAPLM